MIEGYILVFTTSSAFECEAILKAQGIAIKLVPTPREFSSDCGIAVYFQAKDEAEFNEIPTALKDIEYEIRFP